MRRPHPAAVALAVIPVVSLIALWDSVTRNIQNNGFSWSGEPSDEVVLAMALHNLSWALVMPALGTAAAASVLGLVLIWCLSPDRQSSWRSTRTMREAGSTRNRAETTEPNSSPSISNSSGAASISMSTTRPCE
jgi:hypothetical protein